MAVIRLRPPLRELAGGEREVTVAGGTVRDALRELERSHPKLNGWVLDDQGRVRQHVAVFLEGERVSGEAALAEADRLEIVGAVSGGSDSTEVLVGTKKGLFVLRGGRGHPVEIAVRAFPGQVVEYATRDRRTGRYYASVTHGQFGPRVFMTDDPTGDWQQTDGPRFPEGEDAAVARIWTIVPGAAEGEVWAGVDPAALFQSVDGGATWELNRGMWDQPGRNSWQPGFGGLALHSICPWPGEPDRIAIGISAVGVWLSEDGGRSWRHGNEGLVPRYLPEEARAGTLALCVHNMHRAPLRPERVFMQFHGGVYRSDDAGETWIDIAQGLPSDFGFPLVLDPGDPDRAFVIPLVSGEDRVTPEGRLRVYETADAGLTWTGRTEGLPQAEAYLTILRQAFGCDGEDPAGLYFGSTSGELFGSADGGRTWATVAPHLAPVLSVRVA